MQAALWLLVAGLLAALRSTYAVREKWDDKLIKACEEWLQANAQHHPSNRRKA